jgi:hypothetical protein
MLQESPQRRPNIYQVVVEVCSMRHRSIPIKDVSDCATLTPGHPLTNPDLHQSNPVPRPEKPATAVAGALRVFSANHRHTEGSSSQTSTVHSRYCANEKRKAYRTHASIPNGKTQPIPSRKGRNHRSFRSSRFGQGRSQDSCSGRARRSLPLVGRVLTASRSWSKV